MAEESPRGGEAQRARERSGLPVCVVSDSLLLASCPEASTPTKRQHQPYNLYHDDPRREKGTGTPAAFTRMGGFRFAALWRERAAEPP